MATKLDTPVTVDSPVGPVEATHKTHNFAYNESGVPVINSSISYAKEVDGQMRVLKELSNCSITGDDLAAITSLTPDNIFKKHEEIVARKKSAEQESLLARKVQLEKELAAISSQI